MLLKPAKSNCIFCIWNVYFIKCRWISFSSRCADRFFFFRSSLCYTYRSSRFQIVFETFNSICTSKHFHYSRAFLPNIRWDLLLTVLISRRSCLSAIEKVDICGARFIMMVVRIWEVNINNHKICSTVSFFFLMIYWGSRHLLVNFKCF